MITPQRCPLSAAALALPAAALTLLLGRPAPARAQAPDLGAQLAPAIAAAQQRVVKLYGGAIGREQGYGSGVLVSPDGWIVTTTSVLLESPSLRAVLPDGRRFPARILARDETRQLVLLDIEADGLPYFDLEAASTPAPGDWLIAAANPFKVADGDEPVSIMVGPLSAVVPLDARRRAQDVSYRGPVLLLDMIVASPGSAGGAVVDAGGNLVGIIGRSALSTRTNTWLNYAIPAGIVAEFLAAPPTKPADVPLLPPRDHRWTLADFGLHLFNVGVRQPPPFIERIRPGSPAAAAGLKPADLILSVDGHATNTCDDLTDAIARLPAAASVELIVKRGDLVLTLTLQTPEASP